MTSSPAAGSRAEAQLFALSNSITDAVVCAEDGAGVVFWNPAAERMFGWTYDEVQGQPLTMLMPERFRAAHEAGVKRVLAGGEPHLIGRAAVELAALHRDGHEVPIELSLGQFNDGSRRLFTGVLRDISERRRQQRHRDAQLAVARALSESGDELEAARRLLDALGTTMGWSLGAVWLADATGDLRCATTWAVPGIDHERFGAACRSLPVPAGDGLIGTSAAAGTPTWMPDAALDPRYRRREALEATGLRGAVALPMLTDQGVVGVVEFYTRDVAAADAEEAAAMEALCVQLGLVFLRKRAEHAAAEAAAETQRRAAELERSNHELNEFAAIASHDLSEPLRTVTGFLDILQRRHDDELSPQATELVGHAISGTTRMRALIDDLLVYSRAGSADFVAEAVALGEVVATVAATVEATVRGSGGEIRVEGELPRVRGDRGRLEQVVQNLVSNGLKFHGEQPPLVTISAVPEARGWWRVVVEDNGIGIEPGDAGRVFEMFRRLHQRDAYPGTGIGLAVCKRVVEGHGGKIWHEPRPGGGSRFCLTLPASTA